MNISINLLIVYCEAGYFGLQINGDVLITPVVAFTKTKRTTKIGRKYRNSL